MTFSETLDYLYNSLPMFHRVGAVALKPGLDNTIQLCEKLGNPQHSFKSIHIAGTNGKGSSSHMLASILQSAGYKTGLYTSPHLKNFTERIRINGSEMEKEEVVKFVEANKVLFEAIKPSFFEMTVGMAFWYFAKMNIDIAVIEVGLGGRLDSTNIITPELSLITNISFDHQAILGNTLPEIALEKAGIIKKGIPVVISEKQDEVREVFEKKASENNTELFFASDSFSAVEKGMIDGEMLLDLVQEDKVTYLNIVCDLTGKYQLKNILGVAKVVEILKKKGFKIEDSAFRDGLKNAAKQTGLKGRWQVIGQKPLVICDTGHNESGIKFIIRQIHSIKFNKLYWVLGMVQDKDIEKILSLLPKEAYYIFCQATIPRAMDASILAEKAEKHFLNGEIIPNVNAALKHAKSLAASDDLVFVGGSTFVVAEVEEL